MESPSLVILFILKESNLDMKTLFCLNVMLLEENMEQDGHRLEKELSSLTTFLRTDLRQSLLINAI